MDNKIAYVALLVLLLSSSIAFPVGGKVTISKPLGGFVVHTGQSFSLVYEADPNQDGDQLHLNVDDKRVHVIHRFKGATEVGPLATGRHKVCLAINTQSHVPTGAEECISVAVQ